MTSQEDVTEMSNSTSPQHLKQVSDETTNYVSVVHHQDVSVVRIDDVPLVHHYNVSCESQMKHPVTSSQCGTSPPRLRVTLSRDLVSRSLLRFQVTLS